MDKVSYALGMNIAHSLMQSGISELSFDDFSDGLKASLTGEDTALTVEEASAILNDFFTRLENQQKASNAEIASAMAKEGAEFLAAKAKEEGVVKRPSGLLYKVIKQGSGKKPGPKDTVSCHYEGTFTDGRKFDSSYDRGTPASFGVNQVIAGWTEALQLMAEGSVWELYIPYNLAYGEAGAHGAIPPCAALVFKVELLKVL